MEYKQIAKILGLDEEKDLEAAKLLNELSPQPNLKAVENIIKDNSIIIFGAGPSLKKDISRVKSQNLQNSLKIIAADGAVKALLEENLTPHILVTDLDGNKEAIIKANKLGTLTVIHAHGDNIPKLKEIVPKLKNIIGTTQTKQFGKLKNFGGFTDGDRAVFLAKKFKAKLIVLAGMGFGEEIGEYSGEYGENKVKKLEIGKKIVEEVARERLLLNLTSQGENLFNVPKISSKNLKILLKGK